MQFATGLQVDPNVIYRRFHIGQWNRTVCDKLVRWQCRTVKDSKTDHVARIHFVCEVFIEWGICATVLCGRAANRQIVDVQIYIRWKLEAWVLKYTRWMISRLQVFSLDDTDFCATVKHQSYHFRLQSIIFSWFYNAVFDSYFLFVYLLMCLYSFHWAQNRLLIINHFHFGFYMYITCICWTSNGFRSIVHYLNSISKNQILKQTNAFQSIPFGWGWTKHQIFECVFWLTGYNHSLKKSAKSAKTWHAKENHPQTWKLSFIKSTLNHEKNFFSAVLRLCIRILITIVYIYIYVCK